MSDLVGNPEDWFSYVAAHIEIPGNKGVHLFFKFLLQNIDCGYLFEPCHRGASNLHPQSMFCAKIRKISIFS